MYCNVYCPVACIIPILLNIEVILVQVHVGRNSCLLLYFSSKFCIQARFAPNCTVSCRLDIIPMSWAKPIYVCPCTTGGR